jgi:predicted MFS family arabinose efflux permease
MEGLVAAGLLERIAASFGVSVSVAGQLTSAFAIAAGCGVLPLVRAASGLPSRSVLVVAMTVQALVNGAIALSPSLNVILVLRVISGAAASVIPPNAAALAVALAGPSRRVLALAWTTAGVVGAFLVGIPAATGLGHAVHWRAAFALCAVLSMLGGVASSGLPALRTSVLRGSSTFVDLVGRRAIWLPLIVTLLGFAAAFTAIGFAGPITSGSAGPLVSVVQACLGVGAVGGLPIAVRLTATAGPRAAAAASAAVMAGLAIGGGALAMDSSAAGAAAHAVGLILIGAGLFGLSPPIQAALVAAATQDPATALAFNAVAVFVGQALGAALGGAGIAAFGLGGAPVVGLAVGTLAVAASLALPGQLPPHDVDR